MKKRRKYELKARAESQEETRGRITVAALELHEQLGIVRTSIAAIAERAGVQRLTVYRHFPDEKSLFRACGGRYAELHPRPEPSAWRGILQPEACLRAGLSAIYRHYRETEVMWGHILRDIELSEVLREVAEPRFRWVREVTAVLSAGWLTRGARAAIGHAVQFRTWQSLARGQELSDEEAVGLMVLLASAAEKKTKK
jgi:AcrR family transcriptional regulator